MKQVIRKGLRDIIVDDVPEPEVAPHHVLVQPVYSLISSGTETADIHRDGILKEVAENPSHVRKVLDVMKQNGPVGTFREVRAKFSDYAVLGYAGAGVIVDRHPTVKDIAIGTRVAYGGEGTGHGEVIMTGRNLVARVPDGVGFDQACFSTLGSIALNGVRVARISLGDTVVVLGLGLVGQLVAQLARLHGARVIATDLRSERTELARRLGAEHGVVGLGSSDLNALTGGRGADCVIVAAAAKSPVPMQSAIQLCRDRGRIVVVGAVEMNLPWGEMYMKEIQLYMARAYGPGSYDPSYEKKGQDYPLPYVRWTENRNMEEFLRLVDDGRLRVDELVTHRYALERAPEAYDTIMTPNTTSLAVLLEYDSPAARASHANGALDGVVPGVPAYQPTRRVTVSSPSTPARAGKMRVALIGASNISRWAHMPALEKLSDVELRAVHSSSGARGKGYAVRFKAAYAATSYDEVLKDGDIDAVIITTRNQHHASQSLAALRAGKHVFVEKPMAITEEECRALVHAQRETGRTLMIGFNRRFAPFYVEQQRALSRRSGPAVINCRVNSPGISGSFWMADPAIGGAILGEACHFVDLFAWMLGVEPTTVSAYSLPTDQPDPIGENNLVGSFQFADGSIANLTYCTVGSRTSGGERVEAFAPGIGVVSEDFKSLSVRGPTRRDRSKWFADKGYEAQLAAFFAAARSGGESPVGPADGARSTVMCLRMLESAKAGGEPRAIDWATVVA